MSVAPESQTASLRIHTVHPESQKLSYALLLAAAPSICQYPLVRSILDRYLLPLSHWNRSSAVVTGSGPLLCLSNFCTHTLLEPYFFLTMTMGKAQLPSPTHCALRSTALSSWHKTKGMAYILSLYCP